MKKALSLILALVMLLSIVPAMCVSAEKDITENNITKNETTENEVVESEIIMSGTYGDEDNISFSLNEEYVLTLSGSGFLGSSIPPWAGYGDEIVKIVLGEGIEDIFPGLFAGYSSLEYIELPTGLERIPSFCFKNCAKLKSIEFPDSCEYIDASAFAGCASLESVRLSKNLIFIGAKAFAGCETVTYVFFPGNEEEFGSIEIASNNESLNAAGIIFGDHVWDEGVVTKDATCTEEGETTFTCTVCGATRTESIEMIPHMWNEGEITTEATCTEDGELTFTCEACGEIKTEPIEKTGHVWDDGVIEEEATTEKEGKRVFTCTACGETKEEKIPVKVDYTPGTPKNFKVSSVSKTYVKLTWSKVSKATGYQVLQYKETTGKYKTLATVKTNSATVKNLTPGTKYKLVVRAYRTVDGDKHYGKKTSKLAFFTILGTPKELEMTSVSKTAVRLVWSTVDGATGYQIYEYRSSTGKYYKVGTVKTNKVKISGLSVGSKYKFVVRAYRTSGGETVNSKISSKLTVYTKTKATEITSIETNEAKSVDLKWKSVEGAEKYAIYKSADGKKWTKVGSSTKTAGRVPDLKGGKKMYFKVIVINKAGAESAASPVKSIVVKK